MNYLAHIFLSGGKRKRQIGNFIGDAVKGRAYQDYPQKISDGILLHRAIDNYTDKHPAVREMVGVMKPQLGRYSAVLLDIFFDYLLASRFDQFSDVPLKRFTRRFYGSIILNYNHLPDRIKSFMWHFISTDRLARYARHEGIRESLEIMVKYRRVGIEVEVAMHYLAENEIELFDKFKVIFADIQAFSDDYIVTKNSQPK